MLKNKFMLRISFLIFAFFLFFAGYSQDVDIIEIDNSEFPKINVYLNFEETDISKSQISVLKGKIPVDFIFDSVFTSEMSSSKSVLFAVDSHGIDTDTVFNQVLHSVMQIFVSIKDNDKLNFALLGKDNEEISEPVFSSAEFTTDHDFVLKFIEKNKSLNLLKKERKNRYFKNINNTLNFILSRDIKEKNIFLIVISGKVENLNNKTYKNWAD